MPERPRKRSQSVSWNYPREYGWDPQGPTIQGIWGFQSISRILSPPVRLGAPLFSEVVPERASESRPWNSQQYWGYVRLLETTKETKTPFWAPPWPTFWVARGGLMFKTFISCYRTPGPWNWFESPGKPNASLISTPSWRVSVPFFSTIVTFKIRKQLFPVTVIAENYSECLRAIISCNCTLLEKRGKL